MRAVFALLIAAAPSVSSAQTLRAVELPSGTTIDAGTTIDEHAMVRIGVWRAGRNITDSERPALARTMDAAYERMNAAGVQPSIFLASHRMQRADAFEALVAEADAPRFGVVFLHGSAGNFTWPCFAMAEVVVAAGGAIVCPSGVGARAAWASGQGPAIVAAAIASLEARGIERIVLAGISSGGIGGSRLLRRLTPRVDGAIFLSGAVPQRSQLPVLLVHGTDDPMIGVHGARAFARQSPNASLLELPGGHFVFAERTAEVQARIRPWLSETLAGSAARRP